MRLFQLDAGRAAEAQKLNHGSPKRFLLLWLAEASVLRITDAVA